MPKPNMSMRGGKGAPQRKAKKGTFGRLMKYLFKYHKIAFGIS